MANEFKVKNGLIVIGDLTTSGTITINGALAATQSWVTSQAYLTSASLSGYATQSYVTSAISALIDAAPAALDTLNELAAALGDDASFSTTVTNSIAGKVAKSGDTMTGSLTFASTADNVRIQKNSSFLNLRDPYNNIHLYNAGDGTYIDANVHHWRSQGASYWMTLNGTGLGIGTQSPSSKLTVYSDTTADGILVDVLSRPRITLRDRGNSDTILGTGDYGLDDFFIDTYSGNAFAIKGSTRNVGIGTTSPSEKLEVSGNISVTSSTGTKIGFNTTDSFSGYGTSIAHYGISYSWTAQPLALSGYYGVGIFTVGTERMRINGGGKVSIGTTDTNSDKSDFTVYTGGNTSIALAGNLFRVGESDINWDIALRQNGVLQTYAQNLYLNTVAGNYPVIIQPNGVSSVSFYQSESYINTYTKINYNWGGGDYGTEAFTIRGTYPSITLRSTTHDSKWLIHHASELQFYYGASVDTNSWSRVFGITTNGNLYMAWAGAYISDLLDAKQNASTAITTSNIGSQSVSYANSAGSATTANIAGALTSMNISQFTNNSNYIPFGSYSWTSPVFGQYGIKSNLIDNVLYSAADRFEVFRDGVAWNTNSPFNLNYDQSCDVIPVNTSRTYSIVLNTKGNPSYGIVYTEGYVYLSFYYVQIPASVSGRVRRQSGTWENMSGWTNVANSGSYAVWRGNVPGGNWMVEIEITINASSSNDTWFAQWEYVMGRPGQYELGIINKAQDNSLWRNMYFRDSSNNVQVSIGASGLSTSQNLHISGTSALYFPSYGGGFYMQDSSWIRTVNYKSIWTQTGLLGTDGGLTVGYGGATPPTGGAIISGNVGIGTSSPTQKLHVDGGKGFVRTSSSSWGQFAVVNPVDNEVGLTWAAEGTGYPGIDSTYTRQWIAGLNPFGTGMDRWSLTNSLLGSNTAITVLVGGNIGIGTTGPETKLHVAGGKITLKGGSPTDQQIVFNYAREYVNGIYNSSGHFRLQDNSLGGTVYQWDGSTFAFPNGNIGIGTTNPGTKLQVVGNAWINRPSNKIDNNTATEFGSRVEFNNAFASGQSGYMMFRYPTYNNFLISGDYDGNIGGAIPNIQFGRQSTVYMHINSSDGNIGIGTTTPASKLHVVGPINIERTGVANVYSTVDMEGNFRFNASGGYAHTFLNNGSELVRIMPSGNVGIGTTSPGAKLEVIGNNNVLSVVSQTGDTSIPTKMLAQYVGLFNNGSNGHHLYINSSQELGPAEFNLTKTWGGFLSFGVSGDGTARTRALYVNSNGYVGVNVNPISGDRFEVAGSVRIHTGNNWDAIQIYSDGANGYIQGLGDETGLRIRSEYGNILLADNRGKVGIGTSSPSENLHVLGRGIFDGGSGNSSTDAVLYVTKSTNDDWGLYINNAGLDYGMYTRVSPSAAYAFAIHNGTTWTTRITGNALIYLGEKNAIEGNYDSWLRLNNSNHYASGVYTPGVMRADGGFQVSGSTVWHAGNDGSGSGLDADLLDGVDSGSFLRSDVSDSFSGTLTMATQRALVPSNYGHGVYGIYSAERYQHVWSMGAGYDLPADGASNGNGGSLYGLAWSYNPDYSYVGSNAQAKPGLNHQLLLMMNGITYTALGNGIWTSGTITTVSHGTSSQWNTAYGWGNHASAGYATTSYVTTQINNLIAGAPGALDTLDELAAALGDDSNFATTVTNSIAGKVSKSGDTMTGALTLNAGLNAYASPIYVNEIRFRDTAGSPQSDPYSMRWISEASARGAGNSWLEFQLNDDNNEEIRIYGNSCVGYGCGSVSENLYHVFRADGYAWHAGNLVVVGTISASGYNSGNWDTAYGWGNHASAGYALNSALANYLPLSGGSIGGALTVNGNLTVNGTITENSSLKLKENVETSEGNLEKVVNLRPVTYNKIGSQTTELGLIAEEVAEVYPEFVQYDENGDPIGVHYSRLTAALIGAVKELTNQVQELNKKING